MADVRLEPMTPAEYDDFLARTVEEYADAVVSSGSVPAADAPDFAREQFASLLPDGLASEGQLLWTAYDGERPVGVLWVALEPKASGTTAYVYELWVHPDARRSGYGRAIMRAGEDECRRRGAVSLGLNVFGDNAPARSLYDQLGFEVTSVRMRKSLV